MVRKTRALALAVGLLGAAGLAAARHDEDGESAALIAKYDVVEKLDGKESAASAVVVTIEPGRAGVAHRHPGPGLGYVLEGEYEWAIDDQPVQILKAGETFYEPAGCLHRVSGNPGRVKTRLMAWVLHPRDAKEIAVPEER